MLRLHRDLGSPPSWSSLSRSSEGLDQQLGMYPAFGGDLVAAVEAAEAMAGGMRSGKVKLTKY